MCCSKAKLKSRCAFFWKLLRRKPPANDDTVESWKTFNDVILKRAFYIHLFSYLARLEAWRSEEEIMTTMT